jgi:hypothetical protein
MLLTSSKQPHQIETGFDQLSQSTLIRFPWVSAKARSYSQDRRG